MIKEQHDEKAMYFVLHGHGLFVIPNTAAKK